MTTTSSSTTTDTASAPVAPTPHAAGVLRPLGLESVRLTGGFWAERQTLNAGAIIPHAHAWEERMGWVANFTHAVEGTHEQRRGREFADSDVYKLLEAMAWEFGRTADPALDETIRSTAALIARAQEPDGYLHTLYGRPGQQARYSDLEWGHELYCYGHLIQAAVARLRTGVRDQLVEVALRAADHVCVTFGPGGIERVGGHPEIEPALVELYRATGERRYLDQATLFIERRGHGTLADIEFSRAYYQDDIPLRAAHDMRGHAVRALYLAAGAIDVATEQRDADLLEAVTSQYRHTLSRRTYLTGGMGSHHQDEAFGDDFELPPDRAYSETCAGVASAMVSWRLALATGDLTWGDQTERALFNVVATSPSRNGQAFFYTNPLQKRVPGAEADPDAASPRALALLRAPWFDVSCCPTNVSRTFAHLACYLATTSVGDVPGLQIHQYASAEIATELAGGGRVALRMETDLPAEGTVRISIQESPEEAWELTLRVPDWSRGRARLDGVDVPGETAVTRRVFRAGDVVTLELDVAPRIAHPDPRVDAIRGCVAVTRGPLVLCLESTDLDGHDVAEVVVDPDTVREEQGETVIEALLPPRHMPDHPYATGTRSLDPEHRRRRTVRLHPYYDWAERGPSTMRVWMPALVPTGAGSGDRTAP